MGQGSNTQTGWGAGEVTSRLRLGENLDLIRQGAPLLENTLVTPQGVLVPLPGSLLFGAYEEPLRPIPFRFSNDITYDLLFRNAAIDIYSGGSLLLTLEDQQWQSVHLPLIRAIQKNDELYVVCGVLPPKRIIRQGDLDWVVDDFDWFVNSDRNDRVEYPYHKFEAAAVTLLPDATTGSGVVRARLTHGGALYDMFTDEWVGAHIRIKDREIQITSLSGASPTSLANMTVIDTLRSTDQTADWEERAFSDRRGWPVSIGLFQTRLALVPEGARNTLFHSRADDFFNFMRKNPDDTVLDTHGISQTITSDTYQEILEMQTRDLQQLLMTSGGLFSIEQASTSSGFAADNHQQRRLWSVGGRSRTLVVASGAGIYCPADGSGLYENAFDKNAQTVVTKDLSIPSEQLFESPIVQVISIETPYRVLFLRNAAGQLRTITYAAEQGVFAFTRVDFGEWTVEEMSVLETNSGHLPRLVLKNGDQRLFVGMPSLDDREAHLHGALDGTLEGGTGTWTGLEHFEGEAVDVVADGSRIYEDLVVSGGQIVLPNEDTAESVRIGFKATTSLSFYMPPMVNTSAFPKRMEIKNVGLFFKDAEIRGYLIGLDNRVSEPVDTIEDEDWTMGNYDTQESSTHTCQVTLEEPLYWELIGFCYDYTQNGF